MKKTLYVSNRVQWRAWLKQHHRSETEVWLLYYKGKTASNNIPYEDAVEEALCFGWIDSIIQRIDDECYARKFTPRTNNNKWSPSNIARMRKLVAEKRMTAAGLTKIAPELLAVEPVKRKRVTVAPEFMELALRTNPLAWENFQKMAPSSRALYIGWISDAKKEETRRNRLEKAIVRLEKNEKMPLQ